MTKKMLLTTAAFLAMGGIALAQNTTPAPSTMPQASPPATTAPANRAPSTMPSTTGAATTGSSWSAGKSANDIIGKAVYNAAGERIGEIDDLVLPKSGGSAGANTAAVIGVGGFLGMGEHKVAVPLSQLQMSNDRLTAGSITKDSLKAMPQYKADDYTRFDRSGRVGG
jgi:sporulation protein YlmC with PRC-barrel domain